MFPLLLMISETGPVVRGGPNTLSISSLKAVKTIYGNKPLFLKNEMYDASHPRSDRVGKSQKCGEEKRQGVEITVAPASQVFQTIATRQVCAVVQSEQARSILWDDPN
jgi:hypothetical protein